MLKFALDLTWIRHRIVGGTESFTNNLIKGFLETKDQFEIFLIAADDNYALFEAYKRDPRVHLIKTDCISASVVKRIIWQNTKLSKTVRGLGLDICLEPVYAKPIMPSAKIKYITVIHDLEALHYPQYHSKFTNIWLRISWKNTVKSSKHIISISNFVRDDIIKTYKVAEKKITTIFDPIIINTDDQADFCALCKKYNIDDQGYYYTVSKLNPHKNLSTLVRVFGEIKKRKINDIPCKLLISGVNGGMAEELHKIASEYEIEENMTLTGFVEDPVRNSLYKHAKAFLFPSVFEGFGMPPIEALSVGTNVITTREACIPEITQETAIYVENPYSVDEWIEAMQKKTSNKKGFDASKYLPRNIADQYLNLLRQF